MMVDVLASQIIEQMVQDGRRHGEWARGDDSVGHETRNGALVMLTGLAQHQKIQAETWK